MTEVTNTEFDAEFDPVAFYNTLDLFASYAKATDIPVRHLAQRIVEELPTGQHLAAVWTLIEGFMLNHFVGGMLDETADSTYKAINAVTAELYACVRDQGNVHWALWSLVADELDRQIELLLVTEEVGR